MNLTARDRRILMIGAVVAALILVWRFGLSSGPSEEAVRPSESIPASEKRLSMLRQVNAAVSGKEQLLARVTNELNERERGLINADSAAQAQAQIVQAIRKLGKAQTPELDLRSVEIGPVRPFSDTYGEVLVSVTMDAPVEQLVNLLADLTAQKELIATNEIRIGQAHPKQKVIPVRLTLSGIVRRSLVPTKKGPGEL